MMHVAFAAGLLLLLSWGCATRTADPAVPQPSVVETQPDQPPPGAKPVTPGSTTAAGPRPAPPAAVKPTTPGSRTAAPQPTPAAPVARAPTAPAPKPAALPVVTPPSPAASGTLDLKALTTRLKATKAIGVFTKLSLKNKVDDLLQQFSEHHEGKPKPTTAELRQGYDLLMMKVLSLLQDDDQPLASAIVASREAIWSVLANPKTFATLEA